LYEENLILYEYYKNFCIDILLIVVYNVNMIDSSEFKDKFLKMNKKILDIKNVGEGILGGIHEKYWVDCGNKQYLFKYNRNECDFSDFGEVFTSYICFVLGVKCVKAMFCNDFFEENKKRQGVLIESYREKNVKESFSLSSLIEKYKRRHFSGYTVKEVMDIVKEFCFDNNIFYNNKIEQELKEMALIDYLLIQNDRHANNIEFLIVEEKGFREIKLAPMFDNGFCLYLNYTNKENIMILKTLLSRGFVELSLKHVNVKPKFYIEETETRDDITESVVRDLAIELIKNKKLMKIYEKFKKINIGEEIDFCSSLKKETLPSLNKNLIQFGIKNRIRLLDMELIKQQSYIKQEKRVANDLFEL